MSKPYGFVNWAEVVFFLVVAVLMMVGAATVAWAGPYATPMVVAVAVVWGTKYRPLVRQEMVKTRDHV